MKVLIISDNPQISTGYGKLTGVWSKYLIKQGHEVLIMGGIDPNANVPFQESPWEGARVWPVAGYGHAEHVRFFLEKETPDVILANADPRFFDYLFKMDNEIRRVCPLAFYHLWDDEPFPDYNMHYYLSCDKIICGSNFTYELLQTNKDLVTKGLLSYVPIGIDTNIYKPLPSSDIEVFRKEFDDFTSNKFTKAKFIVGVVGRNAERKQLLTILESFSKWSKDKDDTLLFVHAPGFDQNNILAYVLQMRYAGGGSKIVYSNASLRQQPDDLINKFYNFFDVLVNRSSAEGFGLPIAEAMAAGTPCIAVNCAGPRNLITPDNGWLLKAECTPLFSNAITPYIQLRYGTDATFEAALDEAYKDTTQRLQKASKCRDYIVKNYSQSDMVKGIERELLDAVKHFKPYPDYTFTGWPESVREKMRMYDVLDSVVQSEVE